MKKGQTSYQAVRDGVLSILSAVWTAENVDKKNQLTKYLENNNIRKNAQYVSTIASVCSPKLGNDRLITMGAITYSREFVG